MLLKAKTIFLLPDGDSKRTVYPGETVNADESIAQELISLGAAVEMARPGANSARPAPADVIPGENPARSENAQNGPENDENGQVSGHLDGEQLQDMSFADLKALAKDMGIDTGKIRSKAGMIEAITAVEVYAEASDTEDAPPVFDAQDVIDE